MNKTIEYYNKNADLFKIDTQGLNFTEIPDDFLKQIRVDLPILDFGCGTGRDSKYFKEKGFQVVAVDGSKELCKIASEYLNQKVICSMFEDFKIDKEFGGIWACASLLHLETKALIKVLNNLSKNLIVGGCLYCSFKYGYSCQERNGRLFNDFTEDSFNVVLNQLDDLYLEKCYYSDDLRDGKTTKWINFFLRKAEHE